MGRKSKKRITKDDEINESKTEDVCKGLAQLKQEKAKKKAIFAREKNSLLELFDEEIPSRRKLREVLSRLSKAQESVINGIINICDEYRRNNQEKNVRSSMEEIEFIENTSQKLKHELRIIWKKENTRNPVEHQLSQSDAVIFKKNDFKPNREKKKLEEEINFRERSMKQLQQNYKRKLRQKELLQQQQENFWQMTE